MRGTLWAYAVRRIAGAVPLLIGVCAFTFVLVRMLPGDPAVFYATGPMATQEEIAQVRRSLRLDQPILVQLAGYVSDVAHGEFGRSLTTGQPVLSDLVRRLPASLELTVVSMVIALLIALPLGIASAAREGSWIDHLVRLIGTIGVSMPAFVTGVILIYVFFFHLGWSPDPLDRLDPFIAQPRVVTGFLLIDCVLDGNGEALRSALGRLVLPSATMAAFVIAPLMRITRASMLAVLASDYIRTARAAGMSGWTVYVRYALRNALLPVITTIGLIVSYQIGANVVVEKVFAWPGIGSYALSALLATDYAPVQGYVLLVAMLFVVINTAIDILYAWIDPRVVA